MNRPGAMCVRLCASGGITRCPPCDRIPRKATHVSLLPAGSIPIWAYSHVAFLLTSEERTLQPGMARLQSHKRALGHRPAPVWSARRGFPSAIGACWPNVSVVLSYLPVTPSV